AIDQRRRLKDLHARLPRSLSQITQRKADRLTAEIKLLSSLSYHAVLERGFAVVRNQVGKPIQGVTNLSPPSQLEIEMRDGRIAVTMQPKKQQGSLF
ncbi:MAG: hypothetical protein KGO94_12940, partial [Alphaproteobacteria bacterium]|nr:hypothetical protein [Alphaproteobacteria bacterium]